MAQNWETMILMLYEQEYHKLIRSAYRMIGDLEIAQDLVQETFLRAIFHQKELSTHPAPGAWLMLTLRNLVQNERRRQSSHCMVPLDFAAELSAKSALQTLDELLPVQLSEGERKILLWRFEQQMNYREIANLLGISEGTCRMRIFRAIEKCRKFLNDMDSDYQ